MLLSEKNKKLEVRQMYARLTLLIAVIFLGVFDAAAQGTAFTYQGHLRDGAVPAAANYDFEFRLFDSLTLGAQKGTTQQILNVPVVNGIFTVTLDFGDQFPGAARFLDISVRPVGKGGAFTLLSPRQPLASVPYAVRSVNPGAPGPPGPAGPVDIVASLNLSFSLDDRTGWNHVAVVGDDICINNIPLGFTFTGWGRNVTSLGVSSNGIMFFGPNCNSEWSNTVLPSSISNDPFLAYFWEDLDDFGSGEFIEYTTLGSPGGRVF